MRGGREDWGVKSDESRLRGHINIMVYLGLSDCCFGFGKTLRRWTCCLIGEGLRKSKPDIQSTYSPPGKK